MPRPNNKKIVVGKVRMYSKYLTKEGQRRQYLIKTARATKSARQKQRCVEELERDHACKWIDPKDYVPQERVRDLRNPPTVY